jgi:hypothetical protein
MNIRTIKPTKLREKRENKAQQPFQSCVKFWTRRSLGGGFLEKVGQFNMELYLRYLDKKYNE